MNDLLQRLSASGGKIGVTCKPVSEGYELRLDGYDATVFYYLWYDEIQSAPAEKLLLKALEAKEEELGLSGPENAWHPIANILENTWANLDFKTVLTKAVQVSEALK